MKDRVGVRLAVAAVVVALAGAAVPSALAIGFSPRHFGPAAPHGYELGQFLGFAEDGIPTPLGMYRESLRGLPAWLQPPVVWLPHVAFRAWALILLPIHAVLASVAFDWANDGGPDLPRSDGDDL